MGRIFHVTTKDMHPGEELFLFYGDEYVSDLGISSEDYYQCNTTAIPHYDYC